MLIAKYRLRIPPQKLQRAHHPVRQCSYVCISHNDFRRVLDSKCGMDSRGDAFCLTFRPESEVVWIGPKTIGFGVLGSRFLAGEWVNSCAEWDERGVRVETEGYNTE